MKEIATVVKTAGKVAVLEIVKRPECDGCKICAFRNGKSRVKVKAYNSAGARAGDNVVVRAEKDHRALASFIVYIVPVLLACAGVLAGVFLFEKEVYTALLCLAGLAVGFLAVFAADKILSKRRGFGMEVVEILQNNAEGAILDEETGSDGAGQAPDHKLNQQQEEKQNGKGI